MNENVDASNLTESERKGEKSLIKRVESKEIVILPTDKSGKLGLVNFATYERMGEEHTGQDPEATLIKSGPHRDSSKVI